MADGFVVLKSYIDSINLLPEERRWPFFCELFQYRIDGTEPKPQSELEKMALVNIFPVIDRSVERWTASKENGAKGGRPRKWIPPEEWLTYYKKHGRKATAEHFGIPEETLKKWIQQVGKKGKNQDMDIDMDKDMDTDTDIHILNTISNNNQKNIKKSDESPKPPKSGTAPRPMMTGYEFTKGGVRYRINEEGEAVIIGTEE